MNRTLRTALYALSIASLSLAACGDDEDEEHGDHTQDGGDHDDDTDHDEEDAGKTPELGFFVASDTSKTGDLGGLSGADARCNRLATAAGVKSPKFAAYLSAENDGDPIHARDRIGKGPWYNAKGELLAKDVAALHALPGGDADLFLTEKGAKINGQWEGSSTPNEHDILTGSDAQGRVVEGKTCEDWTSDSASLTAQVGHSDGLGPNRNPAAPYNSWNSSHESMGCNDTAPRGGAGHIYCFSTK